MTHPLSPAPLKGLKENDPGGRQATGDHMPKGYKTCPECNNLTGPRTQLCKCGHTFSFKSPQQQKAVKEKKFRLIEDWRELQPGEFIKVSGRSGPYYQKEGERMYLSNRGLHCVIRLDENGIHARGVGNKSQGYVYLYMGKKRRSKLCYNLFRAKHKIIRAKGPR